MVTVVAWIVVFGVLVAVHEAGHFFVAKAFGMRVDEYSIGFGPGLFTRRFGETQYSVRAIPLGGYVRLRGMDGQKTDDPNEYPNRPLWQRFLVIFAGPVMNMLLAAILYIIVMGPIGTPVETTVIQQVMAHYPAHAAGLRAGDRILAIDGRHIAHGTQVSTAIGRHVHQAVRVAVMRGHQRLTFSIHPRFDPHLHRYLIGIQMHVFVRHLAPLAAIKAGVAATVHLTRSWFVLLYKLVTGQHAFDLMGPVGIFVTVGEAAHAGWYWLFTLAAALSANLGLFNILPVPVLDGSKLFLLGVEAVRRRAMDPDRENMIHLVGMAFLLVFVAFVTYHDIVHYLHLG